jgi:hypothetical protein
MSKLVDVPPDQVSTLVENLVRSGALRIDLTRQADGLWTIVAWA